jgi:hypothetical protein
MNHARRNRTFISLLALAWVKGGLLGLLLVWGAPAVSAEATSQEEMAAWVAWMKKTPKGPFDGIFWYCQDGAVLPPEPYACTSHGGGIQHGRLGERARALRAAGFLLGNVLAATDPEALADAPGRAELKAILLERYLVAADNGWILRRARYYRGAFQVENEIAAAQAILSTLGSRLKGEQDFLLLRQAALLLPLPRDGATVTRAYELSSSLATLDMGFAALRNKIHGQMDVTDAERVRSYARKQGRGEPGFEQLAQAIEALFVPRNLVGPLGDLSMRLGKHPLAARLQELVPELSRPRSPAQRFATSATLLAQLRDALADLPPALRVAALKLGLDVEAEAFAAGRQLLNDLSGTSRARRLVFLGHAAEALYGVGLLSPRERLEVQEALIRLAGNVVPLGQYRSELAYLARVPAWAGRELSFHFAETVMGLARIEPLASQFVPERLRASPLLIYAGLLDGLLRDVNGLAGIEHQLFGQQVGAGLRALNPGLARGVLRLDAADPRPDGIHVLPETTASLPPVAGVLTLKEGNVLSHVQILASNLGIPNVVVDAGLMPHLRAMAGRRVVLAASPGGRVILAEDGPHWDTIFGKGKPVPASMSSPLQPDLAKLDLSPREPLPLEALRAGDAGRIAGPKAANLGELRHHYPEAVADGLVIPFGAFLAFLEQPMTGTGKSAYQWMRAEYRRIAALPPGQRAAESGRLRQKLRAWIGMTEPGQAFRETLARAMAQRFGPDGGYAVFVRSDTNVEDLPGFTGAGLNLTVPNVVGVEGVIEAILRVWASPFSERAFAWRQMRLRAPEHVYVSVLLLRSVPVEKSGVMVTLGLEDGSPYWFTVAANEGIGGAVSGQAAEELLIAASSQEVRLLAESSAATRRNLGPGGGLEKRPVSGRPVLLPAEVEQLRHLGLELPARFPQRDETGQLVPADVEFGFVDGRLALFQIRPYLQSREALRNRFLLGLDAPLRARTGQMVNMREGK